MRRVGAPNAVPFVTAHSPSPGRLYPALVLGLALLGVAQAGVKAASEAPPFSTQGIARRTLPNGLRVLVCPRRTAPVVTTQLWYRVGSRDESPGATGLAHFLEHLLFKGTHKLAKGEIDRLTYRYAGSNNAFTFNDYTAYEFNFPKAHWQVSLSIEADRMRNCKFDKAEFEVERQVVMEERRQGQDDPSRRLGEQMGTLLFTAHPYRNPVIGWMEDLRRVSRDQVFAFYRRHYVPGNATLVITGDVAPEEAFAAAGKAFAAVPALPVPRREAVPEPEPVAGEKRVVSRLPAQVARVSIAFSAPPRGHADAPALTLLDYVLSNGRLSRLYRRLVEGEALCAEAGSSLGLYREAGEISLDADLKDGSTLERVERALWDEVERLQTAPVTDRDLQRARNQFAADWVQGLQTANDLANVIGEADATGGIERIDSLFRRVAGATPADLQRVATRYLRRDRAVIGYLVPAQPAPTATKMGRGNLAMRQGIGARRREGRPGEASRRTVPAPAASTFGPLNVVDRRLPNGLRLLLLENHDVPSVQITLRLGVGANQDPPDRPGLAAFTARMLDQGAGSRSESEISESLEQVGATLSTEGRRESTLVELRCLSAHAVPLLPLLADLVKAPTFPPDRVARESARLVVELRAEDEDAEAVAGKAFRELVYGEHPLAHNADGDQNAAAAFTRDDVVAFQRRFHRPELATLVAVGDFRATELARGLESAFGGWEGGGTAPAPLPKVVRQTDVRRRRILLAKTQTQVLLGHLGITRANPDYLALVVMDTILGQGVGGGFTARIPYQLRDVEGLAYSVTASITWNAAREPGTFLASMGTAPEKEAAATSGLLREIRKMRTSGVSADELAEAVNYLTGNYVFDFQTHDQLADYLLAVSYYGLGFDFRRRYMSEVRRVTRADVLRVAQKYLDPDHYTLVVVGPR